MLLLAGGVVAAVLLTPGVASASLSGPCDAQGVFDDGTVVNPKTDNSAEVPSEGTVNWKGSIQVAAAEDMPYSGAIVLQLPVPLADVDLESWDGETDETSESGSYSYELPDLVPGGFEVGVTGSHTQAGVTCSGSVVLSVAGSSGAAVGVTTVLGAGSAALVGLAGRPR